MNEIEFIDIIEINIIKILETIFNGINNNYFWIDFKHKERAKQLTKWNWSQNSQKEMTWIKMKINKTPIKHLCFIEHYASPQTSDLKILQNFYSFTWIITVYMKGKLINCQLKEKKERVEKKTKRKDNRNTIRSNKSEIIEFFL